MLRIKPNVPAMPSRPAASSHHRQYAQAGKPVTQSTIRFFAARKEQSLESRLTAASAKVAKEWGVKQISGSIKLVDTEEEKLRQPNAVLRSVFIRNLRPATKEEMAANYKVLEESRRNGPSW